MLFDPPLHRYLDECANNAHTISSARRAILEGWARKMASLHSLRQRIRLHFICTHNSRRSQMAQVLAWAASRYYGFRFVDCHSGGTEVTACHPNTLTALERAGFVIRRASGKNGRHRVQLKPRGASIELFSKVYKNETNPASDFIALMTCSSADRNCSFVAGALHRISLSYEDPKVADGTAEQTALYDDRCRQIASEIMFAFHHLHRSVFPLPHSQNAN